MPLPPGHIAIKRKRGDDSVDALCKLQNTPDIIDFIIFIIKTQTTNSYSQTSTRHSKILLLDASLTSSTSASETSTATSLPPSQQMISSASNCVQSLPPLLYAVSRQTPSKTASPSSNQALQRMKGSNLAYLITHQSHHLLLTKPITSQHLPYRLLN